MPRKPKKPQPPKLTIETTSYVTSSSLLTGEFKPLWDLFVAYEGHTFTWGGNNRSLVDFSSFCNTLGLACIDNDKLLDKFLELHAKTDPNLYVDLEN